MTKPGERELEGASVVLTGAAGGIGRALARRFGAGGARIALLDLNQEALDGLAAELTAAGIDSLALACDVTDPDACRDAVADVVSAWGGVDVLVNNAGITHVSLFAETDVEVFRRVMDVNFFGALHSTSAALPSLMERKGRVVTLSSVAGFAPLATRTGYAASKHALHGLFDSLRAEVRRDGVSVTLVCPSFVRTGIGDSALGARGGRPRRQRPETGPPVEPEDLADAIHAAAVARRRLLFFPRASLVSYLVWHIWPSQYERMMTKRIMR